MFCNLHVEKRARMTNWFKYPFIRLLMPFALGLWLSFSCLNLEKNEVKLVLISVVFLGIVLIVIASAVKDYKYRWLFGVILNLHLIILGVAVSTAFERIRICLK